MGIIPLTGGNGVSRLYTPIVQQVGSSIRKVADQLLGIETATVVSNELSATETVVVFDNDPNGEQVVARSITGTYEVDTRVYCLKYPPNGVLILGRNDGRLRLNTTGDVNLSSTGHAFQIGQSSGINLRMDNNEILVVNNGVAGSLNLQTNGGRVEMFDQDDGVMDLNDSGYVSTVMQHDFDAEGTNQANYNLTAGSLGAQTCGFTFIAPPSGAGSFTVGGFGQVNVAGTVGKVWAELRSGGTIGSGTLIADGDSDTGPQIRASGSAAANPFYYGACPRYITGLTPGSTYNVSCWFAVAAVGGVGAGIQMFARQVHWTPSA